MDIVLYNCFLYVDAPKTEAVFVLLGDTHYRDVTPTERNQMAMCVVLLAPVTLKIDLDRPCFPNVRGRYLYVVLGRENAGEGVLVIYEIRVYLGELCNITAFNKSRPLIYSWKDALFWNSFPNISKRCLYLHFQACYTNTYCCYCGSKMNETKRYLTTAKYYSVKVDLLDLTVNTLK